MSAKAKARHALPLYPSLVLYSAGHGTHKPSSPQHAAPHATEGNQSNKQKLQSVENCHHITSNVCLGLDHSLQSSDSYSSCSHFQHTNTRQNVPHVLGESLVQSLGEAYQHLADATQGFGITAKVGLSHKRCRRSQSSKPYQNSGAIAWKRGMLNVLCQSTTSFAAALPSTPRPTRREWTWRALRHCF